MNISVGKYSSPLVLININALVNYEYLFHY